MITSPGLWVRDQVYGVGSGGGGLRGSRRLRPWGGVTIPRLRPVRIPFLRMPPPIAGEGHGCGGPAPPPSPGPETVPGSGSLAFAPHHRSPGWIQQILKGVGILRAGVPSGSAAGACPLLRRSGAWGGSDDGPEPQGRIRGSVLGLKR